MCGIAGIVSLGRAVNPEAASAMIGILGHRGPDGEGLWTSSDHRIVLGHRRLAILDPTPCSAQPMASADGALVLTYNGEIYNYLEVREALRAEGHAFATTGDVEVLLTAYRAWGAACVERFNGMFAFALYDSRSGQLFCARDRFGEKPLLYVQGDGWLAFASEYKALLCLAEIPATPDDERLARFLVTPSDGPDRGDGTLFPAIRQLPPACTMTVSTRTLEIRRDNYWQGKPDGDASRLSVRDASVRFRELLDDSVRLRLRSDVPLGSCLSGGLDSGSIACLVRRRLGEAAEYHTFSGRFPGSAADEGPYIDVIADSVRASRHEVVVDPTRLVEEFDDFLWANELPVDSPSQYAQYNVFRLARGNGVLVLLDGQGADEILGGYEQYFAAYLATVGPAERPAIEGRYPGMLERAAPWHASLPGGVRRVVAQLAGRGSDVAFGLRRPVATPARSQSSLHEVLRGDSLDGFLGTLLRYGDRNSMAHAVEVRLPFTDHRLFEFVQGLAAEALMGDAQTKRLLREAMRGILPEPVRTRWRKQGFLPPTADWLKGPLLPLLESTIEDPSFRRSSFWNPRWWAGALGRFKTGDASLASGLWKVLATERWRRSFLERVGRQRRHPALA